MKLSNEAEDRIAKHLRQRDLAKPRGDFNFVAWCDGRIASEYDLQDSIDVAVDRLRRHPHRF